jgi:hypothetical protein
MMTFNKQHNIYLKKKWREKYWAALAEIKVLTAPYVSLKTTVNDLTAMAVVAYAKMLREASDLAEVMEDNDGATS